MESNDRSEEEIPEEDPVQSNDRPVENALAWSDRAEEDPVESIDKLKGLCEIKW